MTKFIILLLVAAAAMTAIKADDNIPNFPFGLMKSFNFGNKLPQQPFAPMSMLNPDYIKNLKPGPGQAIKGAFVSTSTSSKTRNGVTKEKNSGRVVTNDNGKATEITY